MRASPGADSCTLQVVRALSSALVLGSDMVPLAQPKTRLSFLRGCYTPTPDCSRGPCAGAAGVDCELWAGSTLDTARSARRALESPSEPLYFAAQGHVGESAAFMT